MVLSIIITCFNHKDFLRDAVASAINQKIDDKEIFVIENGSSDGSIEVLKNLKAEFPELNCIYKSEPENYCKAFNEALSQTQGKYIVDLSADDILLPEFTSKAIETFSFFPVDFGVTFCNAEVIDEDKKHLGFHFPVKESGRHVLVKPQDGDIYKLLLEKHHISAPTMVIKREVLKDLGGYDEELEYEDFDFWIRSSRRWKYLFVDHVCVKVRKFRGNLGKRFYKRNQGNLLWSTFKVCLKARDLNKDKEEDISLHKRCSYHMKQAVLTEHFRLAKSYYALISSIDKPTLADKIYLFMSHIQWPIYPFYRTFVRHRT